MKVLLVKGCHMRLEVPNFGNKTKFLIFVSVKKCLVVEIVEINEKEENLHPSSLEVRCRT